MTVSRFVTLTSLVLFGWITTSFFYDGQDLSEAELPGKVEVIASTAR